MEFREKLQELRKSRGLTQEELAEALYVSRTAVSKWESGRGYPSIDSLKALGKFFGVTVDSLLSGEELLNIAEEDGRERERRLSDVVFGLFDLGALLLIFLPLFADRTESLIRAVSLISTGGPATHLKVVYFIFISLSALLGAMALATSGVKCGVLSRLKPRISLSLGAVGTLVFVLTLQPYAAAVLLLFLVIKALMLIKWP